MNNTIIVTRHSGLVEYLNRLGITGNVIEHATKEDVKDKDVIGVLPLHLAALTNSYTSVDIVDLPLEKRGKDLSLKELLQLNIELVTYNIDVVSTVSVNQLMFDA